MRLVCAAGYHTNLMVARKYRNLLIETIDCVVKFPRVTSSVVHKDRCRRNMYIT